MSRYKQTKRSTIRQSQKKYYKTTIYNNVPEDNSDTYWISQDGDRLDNLAFRFYGDVKLWWFIAHVNNLKTINVPAGTSIRIPVKTTQAKGY
jgi:nucleoid-associated protein YgaU